MTEPSTKGAQNEIFTVVEQMPEYSGGEDALFAYLGKNMKYPENAKKDSISGTVYVSFVINNKGKVTDAKILRGISPLLDQEALTVIQNMPDWQPGKHEGKEVSVMYNLPVRFQLKL
jgi:TonB family protein